MRIISLVPSWTETLVQAGAQVVGRTRYCIHPSPQVDGITVVGGTKQVDWPLIKVLKPDLLLLDQEENPKSFSEQNEIPWIATHVTDITCMQKEFSKLAERLQLPTLQKFAQRAQRLQPLKKFNWQQGPPGAMKKLGNPDPAKPFVYVIWKEPWMLANHNTFIGSSLQFCAIPMADLQDTQKYPKVEASVLQNYNCLFSSEPFPFHKKASELENLKFNGWIVDGELYSWFGIRSLNFLEKKKG